MATLRVYHVTETASVPSILRKGLVPAIGPRSADLGETGEPLPAVWVFPDREQMDNALMSWFGEWWEEWGPRGEDTELSVLTLDVPEHMLDVARWPDGFEWACYETIPPSMIVEVEHGQ